MKTIHIKPEHRETLEAHVIQIQESNELLEQAQTRFNKSKQRMELLGAAWRRMPKDNADILDPILIRNADIMSHALSNARESEQETAYQSGCIQALKEAMSFFLAEHYAVNVTKEWQLNLSDLTLKYEE